MSQPLKHGRAKQSTQKEQVDRSSIRLPPGRSTRAVTSEDPEFRNTGFGSSKFARGLRIQSTEPAPVNLEINGFLYQRVDRKPLSQSPEPMLEAPSETPQSVARKRKRGSETLRKTKSHESPEPQSEDTSQSPQPMTKKRKRKSKMLREIQSHNKPPERRAEAASASTQRITRTTRKQKHNLKMLRKIQPHNKSPEPRSEISSETPQPIARDSSQPELPKRKRTSNMLRELEAYNESPEGDSEPDIEILDDLKAHLTRSARHDLINISKNRPLSPRKNLNLRTLMLAEFSGMPKGTKTFYPEDNSNVGLRSNRRQPESGKRVEIKIEEEEEEEEEDEDELFLAQDVNTIAWKHSQQPTSTRETGEGKRIQEVTPGSSWSVWDSESGQSAHT